MLRSLLKRKKWQWLLALLLIAVFVTALYDVNRVQKPELVTSVGRTFERATVVEVLKDNVQENGRRYGEQTVRLQMESGPKKGELIEATSSAGYLFGAGCKPGMKVITIQSVSGDITVTSVYSENRESVIYGFLFIFFLLHWIIGGWRGVKAFMGLVFTFICIIFLYLPLVFRGYSPFWTAVLVAVITTFVSMYFIGGWTKKSGSAIMGAVMGVITAGAAATLFGHFAGISGYNVSDIESLMFLEEATPIKVGGLLFSGLLIASLGAVMDMAMSVASTIQEIHERRPGLGRLDLFKSGMTVGRDTMGTMSNTLILAFAGGSISMLVMNYAYNLPYIQMINSYDIGIQIMQGISGSMGVILTVPAVSAVAAFWIGSRKSAEPAEALVEEGASLQAAEEPAWQLPLRVKGLAAQTLPVLRKHWRIWTAVLCCVVIILCLIRFYNVYSAYAKGSGEYEALAQSFTTAAPGASSASAESAPAMNSGAVPPELEAAAENAVPDVFTFDYDKLAAENSDAIGWLRLPDTTLSYPVVQGRDNIYYLTHTFLKNENIMGAIFLDSRIKDGFSARNSILYGHNMRNVAMFSLLCKFRSRDYFRSHPALELYTKEGKTDYAVFAAYEAPPDSEAYTSFFENDEAFGQYLKRAAMLSLYDTGVTVSAGDRILTLSTCVEDNRDMRFIVQAKSLNNLTPPPSPPNTPPKP